jgi:hypothetical protein
MVATPLSQAVLQGMDPNVYRSLNYLQQGDELSKASIDSSPTSKWGAIGRLAQALSGTYLQNSATSDLAKTIAGGKKSATDQLMEALQSQKTAAVPTAPPAMAPSAPAPIGAPSAPIAAAPAVTPEPGSPNAQVAARFPAEMSPGTAASPLPNNAPSPLDTAAYPAGPVGAPGQTDVASRIIAAESGGNPNAQNPRSSAGGAGQFIDSTWLDTLKKAKPELAAGKSDAQLLALKNDPALSREMVSAYAAENGKKLDAAGVPVTAGTQYLAHFAGPAGAQAILKADPSASAASVLGPAVIKANPFLANMSVADLKSWADQKMGPDQAPYQVAGPATAAPAKAAAADDEEAAIPANAAATQLQSAAAPAAAAAGGVDVHKLMAVLQNPYADDTTKQLAQKLLLAHLTPSEDTFGVTGEGPFGDKKYGFINAKDHTINGQPADKAGGASANSGGPMDNIDSSKTGDDYLKQFPPEIQASVKDYIAGNKMPTGNPRRTDIVRQIASKYGAEVGLPADDTAFSERRKMRTDLGASTPNSMGGILSNGKSSFAHLADASDRMVGLGNYNGPNTPGGAVIGTIGNTVGNTLGTPDTAAKITGIKDNLLKYGQEATKFYAGTGGGEAERMNAAKTMDPTSASSKQQAEFLETEKGLMVDRLTQKENDVRRTLGQDYLDKHPIRTPDFEANIKRIDSNIAKLGGSQSGTTAGANAAAASGAPDRAAIEAEMRKRGILQ